MELKYKSSDTIKLIDIFANLSKEIDDNNLLAKEIERVSQYPAYIVDEFLKCVNVLTIDQVKTKYIGVIGFITLQLNFCFAKEAIRGGVRL